MCIAGLDATITAAITDGVITVTVVGVMKDIWVQTALKEVVLIILLGPTRPIL